MARRRRPDADPTEDASLLSGPVSPPLSPISFSQFRDVDQLSEIQDRRRYHPEAPLQAPLSFSGLPATIGDRNVNRRSQQPVGHSVSAASYPSFSDPSNAVVCARRQTRREVMFAKRYYRRRRRGSGGGRRNYWSDVKC